MITTDDPPIAADTASRLRSGHGDLVTLGFGSEADAELAEAGASWALGEHVTVERTGTTVRARAAGAAERVAQFVGHLADAGAPVRRLEVAPLALADLVLG